eukprot:gene8287-823_t
MKGPQKVRGWSPAEYLEYFQDNEVHMLANKFELPEYVWAENKIDAQYRVMASWNEEVFQPAREKWIEKYKEQYKAVHYAP